MAPKCPRGRRCRRHTHSIATQQSLHRGCRCEHLREGTTGGYKPWGDLQSQLEKHYKDMQDIEFTIERGKLCLKACGKRSPSASIRAVDLVHEGLISKKAPCKKLTPALELICAHYGPSPRRSLQKVGLFSAAALIRVAFTSKRPSTHEKGTCRLDRLDASPEDIQVDRRRRDCRRGRTNLTRRRCGSWYGQAMCCWL